MPRVPVTRSTADACSSDSRAYCNVTAYIRNKMLFKYTYTLLACYGFIHMAVKWRTSYTSLVFEGRADAQHKRWAPPPPIIQAHERYTEPQKVAVLTDCSFSVLPGMQSQY